MKILVHCTKPMLMVHRHPHLMEVGGVDGESMAHLSKAHDHHVMVTVKMQCGHLERDKDLLLLHQSLQKATAFPERVYFDTCSFEQVCVRMRDRVLHQAMEAIGIHVHIYSVKVAAHDEGAEVIWGSS